MPGHEAAGEIAEVGPGVTTVKPGDHVIFSFRPHCGRCQYCTTGRTVLCIGRNALPPGTMFDGTMRLKHKGQGIAQMARIGTFAEEVVVPEEMVVPIRKDMPWPQAALVGCCVATGVGAVTRHAKIEAGSTVLVIGCGGVGLNAVQGAMLSGARTIIAADIRDNKLEMARTFGATHTINTATDNDPVKKVKEITGPRRRLRLRRRRRSRRPRRSPSTRWRRAAMRWRSASRRRRCGRSIRRSRWCSPRRW